MVITLRAKSIQCAPNRSWIKNDSCSNKETCFKNENVANEQIILICHVTLYVTIIKYFWAFTFSVIENLVCRWSVSKSLSDFVVIEQVWFSRNI